MKNPNFSTPVYPASRKAFRRGQPHRRLSLSLPDFPAFDLPFRKLKDCRRPDPTALNEIASPTALCGAVRAQNSRSWWPSEVGDGGGVNGHIWGRV
ncbi:hypothetical protein Acr_07g0001890 [Actinidia rufa]|uniref:Uncharacterized protein n=1 Tax=Actinidia rufa TaxID=165716 RepID=A0A7J0EUE4_9ERIC|nr:hypothetical protein Acr_07g0001890 [Actinidia rufa]